MGTREDSPSEESVPLQDYLAVRHQLAEALKEIERLKTEPGMRRAGTCVSYLAPKQSISVDYAVPPSRRVLIRVVASKPVDVYVMLAEDLAAFREKRSYGWVAALKAARGHQVTAELPPAASVWYLVVENPWDEKVDLTYTAIALELWFGRQKIT
jgi:hypothetical protein